MRPPQTTTSVDRLFSWTNRPATVCWSCALQQRRPLSRSSPGADEAQDATPRHTIRGYEAWSERGRRSGPLGGSQPTRVKRPLIRDNLANGPDQGGSDVHFGPQTPRLRAPPTPPKLNVYGFSKRQVKRSLERGSLLPGMLKFGSKPNSPKHFPVSFTSDDDLSESRLPQSKLRTIKHGTRTVSVQDESEQRLDAALDHWNSNLALSISEPSDTLAGLDTVDPNSQSIWGHRPGKVPLSGLLFAKNKRANTGQSLSDFKTSSTSSIGFVRAAHTSSMRERAAAHHQETPTPELYPPNIVEPHKLSPKISIREHLRLWQEQHSADKVETTSALSEPRDPKGVPNLLTRIDAEDTIIDPIQNEHDNDPFPEAEMGPDGVVDFEPIRSYMSRGDLVELSSTNANQPALLAIFIRDFESQSQFYTIRGRWVHRMAKNIYFQVQGFVTAAEVAELLPYLPAGEIDPELEDRLHLMDSTVPRDVGSKLVTKMISFSNASEKAYRKQSTRLDNAHDIVAHDTDITYMTLPGIASKIDSTSKKPRGHQFSQSTLYAVHRALMQNEFGFGVDLRSHRTTGEFEIRPKRELQSVNEVRQWLRVYQEKLISSNATKGTEHALANYTKTDPIGKFIEEAHQLIRESRKNRIPTKLGNVGPSPIRLDITRGRGSFKLREGARFSDTSKSIIRFFEIWAGYRSFSRHVPLNSLASLILRAIGMYEDYELDHLVGWLLLQELGVYAPWENRLILNTKLGLPGHHITKEADQMRLENIRAGRSTSTLTDTMQAFRKDWGDMEVFCIDDADAREIDDGISLEEIPGSESTAWVHVHTANPSAFIAKDSPLAKYAAHLTETVYLPERSYPMLPPYITREHFSLAADRPTLTFSAKMTRTGEILEAKITPGIIRKVTFVTPRTMRKVIAPHVQPKPETVITVGGEMPSRGRTGLLQNVTESQKHVLRKLRDLGAARRYQRQKKGAVYVNLPFPQSLVYLGPHQDTPTSLASRGRSCHYDGDPVIQLCAEPFDPNPDPALSGADHLVPDLMMLAGEVAASWCKARNIPVLYRGTQRNSDVDPEAFRQQTVLPTIAKLGYLPLVIGLQYMKLLGRSVVSTTPREHTVIGVDQYAKCTSPLRRFGDLLLHWQVESALRQEAESGKSLVGSRDRSYLAMPLGEIDAMIPQLELRARMISGVKRSSMRHWQAQLMFRAFYFKEAPLPETWELFIFSMGVRSLGGMYSGILKLAATDAEMQPNKLTEEVGVELGDWWEVKIVKVDAYNRSMTTEAVRLIRKARDDGY